MYSEDSSFEVPKSLDKKPGSAKSWYKRWWGILAIMIVTLILVLAIAIGFYFVRLVSMLRSGEITPQDLFGEDFSDNQGTGAETLIKSTSPTIGPRDAKVVIVEFGDLRCPACRKVAPVVKEIIKKYQNQVLFVWRDFPAVDEESPEPLLASLAGRCANEQGRFWEMQDKIINQETDLTETDLNKYAVQVGLNSFQFSECLKSGKYLEAIKGDFLDAYTLGITATPTFIINSQKIPGAISLDIFEQVIINELNKINR